VRMCSSCGNSRKKMLKSHISYVDILLFYILYVISSLLYF
jgi:hypothetical protein